MPLPAQHDDTATNNKKPSICDPRTSLTGTMWQGGEMPTAGQGNGPKLCPHWMAASKFITIQ